MRGGLRSACSLVIVFALAGCAGSSWQFWKASESTQAPADSTGAAPAPAEAPVTATPAPAPVPTASPATPPVQVAVVPPPSPNGGYKELADVRFRSGQIALVKADHKVLDNLMRFLKEHRDAVVMIEGHTDDRGTREENLAVGEKRADAVLRYLVSRGLERSRVTTTSVGSDRPACTEKTDACRAKNRRVRLLVRPH